MSTSTKTIIRRRRFTGVSDINSEEYSMIDEFLKSYKTLSRKGHRVNGKVIEVYIEIIKHIASLSGVIGVYFRDTLASMQLLMKDVVNNMKFCRKILISINNLGYWHLVEVNFETQEFRDYNSLCDYITDDEVARWSDWLGMFFAEMIPNIYLWNVIDVKTFPQQKPGSIECGVFMMKAIEQIAYDNIIKFEHKDMRMFRGKIAVSILKHAKIESYDDFKFLDVPRCEEGDTIA